MKYLHSQILTSII